MRAGDHADVPGLPLNAGVDNSAVAPVTRRLSGKGGAPGECQGERAEQHDSHRKSPLVDCNQW
jgi:hypothetical protein